MEHKAPFQRQPSTETQRAPHTTTVGPRRKKRREQRRSKQVPHTLAHSGRPTPTHAAETPTAKLSNTTFGTHSRLSRRQCTAPDAGSTYAEGEVGDVHVVAGVGGLSVVGRRHGATTRATRRRAGAVAVAIAITVISVTVRLRGGRKIKNAKATPPTAVNGGEKK